MDFLSFLRTIAALGTVLGLLWGALWAVKRYNIALPGQTGVRTDKRLALVERVSIDAKRALILVRRDGCEHLIMIGPDGQTVVETGIVPAEAPEVAAAAPGEPPATPKVQQDFGILLDLAAAAAAKAKTALVKSDKPLPMPEAEIAAPRPKRPPVRLKVTAPDGRTVVEPIAARDVLDTARAA
ncbi:MAG TPA: flagellar biosynthetic protein FliO [Allosphingosinicella sp.]|jgi:flagellar biogenesis protein FliO